MGIRDAERRWGEAEGSGSGPTSEGRMLTPGQPGARPRARVCNPGHLQDLRDDGVHPCSVLGSRLSGPAGSHSGHVLALLLTHVLLLVMTRLNDLTASSLAGPLSL